MSIPMASSIKLNKPSDWPRWFLNIEHHAHLLDVWHIIDPDETIVSEKEMLGRADKPRTEHILKKLVEERAHHFRIGLRLWENPARPHQKHFRSPDTKGEERSEPGPPTQEEIGFNYQAVALKRRREQDCCVDARDVENVLRLHNLIASSVNDDIFHGVLCQLKSEGQHGVRATLQALRKWAASTQDQPAGEWEWVVGCGLEE